MRSRALRTPATEHSARKQGGRGGRARRLRDVTPTERAAANGGRIEGVLSEEDCYRAAVGQGLDPSGAPWAELDPALLRQQRTSIKWSRYPADVLPLFVAEMDFAVAPEVRRALVTAVEASDIGYLDGPGPLAEVFSEFAERRWGWAPPRAHVHLATDVATGLVEALRVFRPEGGRLVLPTPSYPGFYEMLEEVPFEVIETPLVETPERSAASADGRTAGGGTGDFRLDLDAIERQFEQGANAFILCNPHNPHGIPFDRGDLERLASIAATHEVFVVSDEIHAPLTHRGHPFTPFAPLAAEAGALSVTVTSASKGWNLAGGKCSIIVAADERANRGLRRLPSEVLTRTSILGLHANVAAFTEGQVWLDRAVAQIEANQALLVRLVEDRLPGVRYAAGRSGYLAWLDLRQTGLGQHPAVRILKEARVALNDGRHFGAGGVGHARLNLACAPDTLVEAVDRIAALLASAERNHA